MTEKIILIDTNIWLLGFIPIKEIKYQFLHKKANLFITEKLQNKNTTICISTYQIGEIMELFRRYGLNKTRREEIFTEFFTKKFITRDITLKIIKEAFDLSDNSSIHIYDYLVALPAKNIVEKIYSADDHFQHKDFTSICKVTNPLSPWILREGRQPEKK